MTPKPGTTPLDRLKAAYRRDPKKVAMVGGLSVVMAALWGRNLFAGPAAVSAASVKPATAVVTPKPPVAGNSPADVALLQWLDGPAPAVSRNLFGVDPTAFPTPAGAGNTGRTDYSDSAAKSDPGTADEQRQQQAAEALRNDSAKLKLQSTVLGPHPLAVVNGQLVGVGDNIGDFRVEKIAARSVTLVREQAHGQGDVRIELTMD
jgi:hypothetical protein